MHKYSDEERAYLEKIVPGRSQKEITELFNSRFGTQLSIKTLSSAYKRFGFSTGRTGYYPKGHSPANKGQKMSPEVYEKARATMFKKGQNPQNHKPVGTESVRGRKTRKNSTYIWIKVAEPNVWRMKQVITWEEHYGPVPEGKIVIFLDGDHMNCNIDNLAIVDKATNVRLNQNHLRFQDKELTEASIRTAELMTAIGKVTRKRKKRRRKNVSKDV